MPQYQALADAVRAARADLRMSQRQLAKAAGVSLDLVQAIEKAKARTYQAAKKNAIEDALGWPRGAIDQLLHDGTLPESAHSIRAEGRSLRERIATMGHDEVVDIAALVHEATGSMTAVMQWRDGVAQIQSEVDAETVRTSQSRGA